MISYLKGEIIELDFNSMSILTSSGVGYEVFINPLIYSKLSLREDTELYIYHHRTENSQSLFGFIEKDEKNIFSELIKISGVGGKVAMLILGLGVDRLIEAIAFEDKKTIEEIKGIGKKMAEKIVIELKDKDFGIRINQNKNIKQNINNDIHGSIKETLVNMGYNAKDVENILYSLPKDLNEASEIIPYVIKELS